jgi:argininosuccinate lyase/amino-acid N-acetyltransferase
MGKDKNLWGGRFTEDPDKAFFRFNRSFGFDKRLFEADVRGSVAHCNALERAGVLSPDDAEAIRKGLELLVKQSRTDPAFLEDAAAEDVHSFIESSLVAAIGDAGKKLHMGRSRNDQIATAMRIWTREACGTIDAKTGNVQSALVALAKRFEGSVLPGYTHLQRAQPVLFAHWCLAYFEMLRRDRERLQDCRRRLNVSPLGSAALAGTSYPIDRFATADELGFEGISRNSLDAVSDRDFCAEFVFCLSLLLAHLSRLAEDIILYCSSEFGFFELSDNVATGSSIMPQKKNPDSMELVRGKSGRVFGDLIGLLTTIKGLPLAYNKDLQEDKEAVFDAFDTAVGCLSVTATVLEGLKLNEKAARAAASSNFQNATELADYLSRKGVPFRSAHEIAGRIVLKAVRLEVRLEEMELEELKEFSDRIGEDVYDALTLESTLASKNVPGGTASEAVEAALEEAAGYLADI